MKKILYLIAIIIAHTTGTNASSSYIKVEINEETANPLMSILKPVPTTDLQNSLITAQIAHLTAQTKWHEENIKLQKEKNALYEQYVKAQPCYIAKDVCRTATVYCLIPTLCCFYVTKKACLCLCLGE